MSTPRLESHLPAEHGGLPRCQRILLPNDRRNSNDGRPRQCRAAAERGSDFCHQHKPAGTTKVRMVVVEGEGEAAQLVQVIQSALGDQP